MTVLNCKCAMAPFPACCISTLPARANGLACCMCCVFDRSLDIFNNITYKHFERHTLYCIFWWYRFVSGHIFTKSEGIQMKNIPMGQTKGHRKTTPLQGPCGVLILGKRSRFQSKLLRCSSYSPSPHPARSWWCWCYFTTPACRRAFKQRQTQPPYISLGTVNLLCEYGLSNHFTSDFSQQFLPV